jgi:hypothetical protein
VSSNLVDPRLAFLACAAARCALVETGAMSLDEAMSAEFVDRFRALARISCHCEREIMAHIDAEHRKIRERALMDWRWRRP